VGVERRLWAVRVDQIELVYEDCGDVANGSNEPSVSNAADVPNGSYAQKMKFFKN
jgi:hypothetical protein